MGAMWNSFCFLGSSFGVSSEEEEDDDDDDDDCATIVLFLFIYFFQHFFPTLIRVWACVC